MAVSVQKIRGPKLEALVRRDPGISALGALQMAEKDRRTIVSNKRITQALHNQCELKLLEKELKSLESVFPCWTGTMTACAEFGATIKNSKMFSKGDNGLVYYDHETRERWVFLLDGVPEKHLSVSNALLVVEHPDYSIEASGRSIVVRPVSPEKTGIIAPFAIVENASGGGPYRSDGFYLPEPVYGIPAGYEILGDPKSMYLFLTHEPNQNGRVGPVSRSTNENHVSLSVRPSWIGHGVLVEAPEK